ncbi:hypothetical protein [Ruegeria intermedia]|uniref:hypothetical protein n=1 Tax=Ruegeria intermedia TaxID=996115 RepID=UPI00122C9C80|nr:hypothetical protein [Ruegeria intermedia]
MQRRLWDLDELILECRSDTVREYIKEAVVCLEAGAIRASIISTWSAVFFDLVEKIMELAVSGEAAASEIVARLENAESRNDIPALLKFEREILSQVKTRLELISEFEMTDLGRIQDDRHRCAHPTFDRSGRGGPRNLNRWVRWIFRS